MRLFFAKELFDGYNTLQNAALLVEQGRVKWVGREAEFDHQAYPGLEPSRCAFLMPGLIDCHVHLASLEKTPETPAEWAVNGIMAVDRMRKLLSAGVVACRDLGSNAGLCLGIARLQKEGGLHDTPYLVCAGQALCATGGHGYRISLECDGPDAFSQGCREVIKQGADVVKVMASGGVNSPGQEPGPPEVTLEEMQAAVQAAHARGRKVAIHAHGNTAIRIGVQAGVDSVEHGVFNSEDILEQMRDQGTFLVPTLSAPYYAATQGVKLDPSNPDHKRSMAVINQHNKITLRAQDMGVKLAMGTDAGCPFNPHDHAYYELVLLSNIGIDNETVLRIATSQGAELLGLDQLGCLKPGKEASFITLELSPLDDMNAICSDKQVYLKGEKAN